MVPTGSQFIGQTYHGLTPTARNQFLKYKFAVRNIDSDDQQIREIFKRINKYSTKLNEQEIAMPRTPAHSFDLPTNWRRTTTGSRAG